jgi:hypothetical protein
MEVREQRSPEVSLVPMQNGGDREQSRECSLASSDLDAKHDEDLRVKMRNLGNIVADVERRELELHVVSSDEPASLAEAQQSPCWTEIWS